MTAARDPEFLGSPDVSLEQAKEWLRSTLPVGARCPCCTQHVQMYRRSIYATMTRALICFYKLGGLTAFVHSNQARDTGLRLGGEPGQLRYWGLVEEEKAVRPDGGRTGYWRVTPRGADWLFGRITVPKYAWIYDGRVLGLQGDQVTVADTLKEPFDLRELRP